MDEERRKLEAQKQQLELEVKELHDKVQLNPDISNNKIIDVINKIETLRTYLREESNMYAEMKKKKDSLSTEYCSYLESFENDINTQGDEKERIHRDIEELQDVLIQETELSEKLEFENKQLELKTIQFRTLLSKELKQCSKENETLRTEVEDLIDMISKVSNNNGSTTPISGFNKHVVEIMENKV